MGAQWKQKGREQAADARGRISASSPGNQHRGARGADPDMNPRLRMAVEAAKKASMTRETLERAIKKGAGLLDEKANYELVAYEGFAPHQVAVIVECLTDNRAHTATSVRTLFRKGQLGVSGSVSWDFSARGSSRPIRPRAPMPRARPSRRARRISSRRGGRDPLLHRARRSRQRHKLWRRRAGRSRRPSPAGARRTQSRSTKRPAGRSRPSCKSSTPTMTCRRSTPRSLEPNVRAAAPGLPGRACGRPVEWPGQGQRGSIKSDARERDRLCSA